MFMFLSVYVHVEVSLWVETKRRVSDLLELQLEVRGGSEPLCML